MEKVKVFMVMPFSNEVANNSYNLSIKPICESYSLEVRRADEIYGTSPIYDDIFNEIQNSSIVIVDITDKNPNVFYELGMAHTLKQDRTIIVTQEDFDRMPFDIRHFRIINYEDSITGKTEFEQKLRDTIEVLLADRMESFKHEFELTKLIFTDSGKYHELIRLVGIRKYSGPINLKTKFNTEGGYNDIEGSSFSQDAASGFKAVAKLGYVTFDTGFVQLTEKGNAFVDYLIQEGFRCNVMNDQVFTPNYISIRERLTKQAASNALHKGELDKSPTNTPQTHPDP